MVRKVIDNFAVIGPLLAGLGLVYYFVVRVWDWRVQAVVYTGLALLLIYLLSNLSKVRGGLQSDSARLGGTALITLLLVVGILALVNFLNFKHHKRVDLSEGQMHSLSEQTRKVLDNLEQDIEIIGFFQDESGATRFQDRLKEYRFYSPRIQYEVVDPQENPGQVAQFGITRDGQIVVAGGGKREEIDDASEEKLTNAIIKVTRDLEKTVYFLVGHGERDLDDNEAEGYSTVKAEIEKQNYIVKAYNLAQENSLPSDASVLISAGPRVNFFPNEVELLEEYLQQGGKFFLLLDPESEFEMNSFLEQFGVGFEDDFVVDASGLGQLFGFGAAAPLAADYGTHPITEDLSGTMTIYPTARSVKTDVGDSEFLVTPLVSSSSQSWGETEIEAEEVSFDEGADKQGPLSLAVVATKKIETGGETDEIVEGSELESDELPEAEPESGFDPSLESEGTEKESRIALIGDPDFASNAYFQTSVNGDFFLNVVSWLAEDADLVSVRPRDPQSRSITLTGAESRLIFLTTVILFPLATIVFGIGVWYRRR